MTETSNLITKKIGELFDYTIPGEWGTEGDPENDIPVLRSTNFTNEGRIDYSNLAFRRIDSRRLALRLVNKETILIEKSGGSPSQPAGRIVYCDENFNGSASNFIEIAKINNLFCPKYIFFLLHFLYQSGLVLKYQQQTTGIINFKLEQYKNEEVLLPCDKQEQTQIATILSTIDRAIEQTEALITKQQRIKTGLMQDLLTKGIDENGNIRSEETHKFKDSPLGRIPVEWEVESCSAICKEIVVGIVIRPAQYYKPSGVPVLRSANVRENIIDTSDMVYMSERDNIALNKSRLSVGDLVTVRTGYPGNTAVITPELDGSNCVDIVISRPDSRRVRSNYLALWINSNFGKKQILEGQGGLAQQHFNVGEVRKLLVKVPRINEQIRIEDLLLLQGREVFKLQSQLQKLKLQKTGLMQDLLTGKVRVTDLLNQKTAAN